MLQCVVYLCDCRRLCVLLLQGCMRSDAAQSFAPAKLLLHFAAGAITLYYFNCEQRLLMVSQTYTHKHRERGANDDDVVEGDGRQCPHKCVESSSAMKFQALAPHKQTKHIQWLAHKCTKHTARCVRVYCVLCARVVVVCWGWLPCMASLSLSFILLCIVYVLCNGKVLLLLEHD